MDWIRTISTTFEFPVAEAMLFQAQCACGVRAGGADFGHVTTATSNKFHTCMQIRRLQDTLSPKHLRIRT